VPEYPWRGLTDIDEYSANAFSSRDLSGSLLHLFIEINLTAKRNPFASNKNRAVVLFIPLLFKMRDYYNLFDCHWLFADEVINEFKLQDFFR
jgi:hypothetical protein